MTATDESDFESDTGLFQRDPAIEKISRDIPVRLAWDDGRIGVVEVEAYDFGGVGGA